MKRIAYNLIYQYNYLTINSDGQSEARIYHTRNSALRLQGSEFRTGSSKDFMGEMGLAYPRLLLFALPLQEGLWHWLVYILLPK